MEQPISMNPDLVYNLVTSNPNLKNLVEQTARLYQSYQQVQRTVPMLQQAVQNPLGVANNFVNWQSQQHVAQGQAPESIPNQQGGQAVSVFDQAMEVVGEFRESFKIVNNNLKEVYDLCAANAEEIKALRGKLDGLAPAGTAAAKAKKEAE